MYAFLFLLCPFSLFGPVTLPPEKTTDTVRGIPIRLLKIESDTFQMGSFGRGDEAPMHPVLLNAFWISETEVTVAQFRAFTEATGYRTEAEQPGAGSYFYQANTWVMRPGINWRHDVAGNLHSSGSTHPVVHISWNDAVAYCTWLSKETGRRYRLPTEAEWEFAAGEGARHMRYPGTEVEEGLPAFGWFSENSNGITHPAGQRQSNAFGLYDMGGNAAEWCADWYHDSYSPFLQKNPAGPVHGHKKVMRGGSWNSSYALCATTDRTSFVPEFRSYETGFRVVRE